MRAFSPHSLHQHDAVLFVRAPGGVPRVHVRGPGSTAAHIRAGRALLHPCHAARETLVLIERQQKEK